MRRDRVLWELRVVVILVAVSLVFYILHYAWFRDLQHIWLWSFTSLAFLPISALVVTLIINRVLSARDKALRLDKLNMLIGVFFSNVGNELLLRFSDWDAEDQYLRNHFGTPEPWSRLHAKSALAVLTKHQFSVTVSGYQLVELKAFLYPRVDSLMRLIENPNLLENENFTQLLRAVFHLAEELSYRDDLESTTEADLRHLAGDIERAYGLIVREWVLYMIFLKRKYPFLFSLAVRTNPLDRRAVATVSEEQRPPNIYMAFGCQGINDSHRSE
ncbi:hypothetical protein ACFL03_13870, partial [Thermodesulfobacteriota bacterium]